MLLNELDSDKTESTLHAGVIAEKIRLALAKPYLLTISQDGNASDSVEHHCTSSIGVVVFIDHEESAEDIMTRADTAMYQAKEAGRNQFRFYEPEL